MPLGRWSQWGLHAAIETCWGFGKKHPMLPTKCRPNAIESGLQVTLLDDPAGKVSIPIHKSHYLTQQNENAAYLEPMKSENL